MGRGGWGGAHLLSHLRVFFLLLYTSPHQVIHPIHVQLPRCYLRWCFLSTHFLNAVAILPTWRLQLLFNISLFTCAPETLNLVSDPLPTQLTHHTPICFNSRNHPITWYQALICSNQANAAMNKGLKASTQLTHQTPICSNNGNHPMWRVNCTRKDRIWFSANLLLVKHDKALFGHRIRSFLVWSTT